MGKFEDFDLDIKNVKAGGAGTPDSATYFACISDMICEGTVSLLTSCIGQCGGPTETSQCQQSLMICTKATCTK